MLSHAAAATRGTKPPGPAGPCNQLVAIATIAMDAAESRRKDTTGQVALEFPAHVSRQASPIRGGVDLGQKSREVLGDELVPNGPLRLASLVACWSWKLGP